MVILLTSGLSLCYELHSVGMLEEVHRCVSCDGRRCQGSVPASSLLLSLGGELTLHVRFLLITLSPDEPGGQRAGQASAAHRLIGPPRQVECFRSAGDKRFGHAVSQADKHPDRSPSR